MARSVRLRKASARARTGSLKWAVPILWLPAASRAKSTVEKGLLLPAPVGSLPPPPARDAKAVRGVFLNGLHAYAREQTGVAVPGTLSKLYTRA
jgi:hypothetical protein